MSQLGLILFMFLVGLELDTRSLASRGRTALAISWSSTAAPFALGALLATWLSPSLAPTGVAFTGFALFLGAAMRVTAFPVLARILEERHLTRTPLGAIAVACAAVDDVSAWLIPAVVVAIVRSGESASHPLTFGGTLVYVIVMLTAGAAFLGRFGRKMAESGTIAQGQLAAVIVVIFVSAGITEVLGIHALFGAFLLPLFFAFTGLRTQLGLVAADGSPLLALGASMLVAITGKFGGTAIAARRTGMSWRAGALLGALMNTRGFMELVILNIAYVAVVSFLLVLLAVVARTVVMYLLLLILPLARLLRSIPGISAVLDRLEERLARSPAGEHR